MFKSFAATAFLSVVINSGLAFAQQQPYPPPQQQPYPAQQQPYPAQQQQQYPAQQPYPQQPYPQQQQPYPQQPTYGQPGGYAQAPPLLPPQQLDQIVGRVALYPDPLLAEVLTASTYSDEIPPAATWAVEHQYLRGDVLAQAIRADMLPWQPSVIALLPFPGVLDQMARDIFWTQQLGNAVLAQRPDVMDAIQRMRQQAFSYGYLRSNPYERVVVGPGDIQILPAGPGVFYVPIYNPSLVYVRPRPGFRIDAAIRFGPAISIGAAFQPWGWGGAGFGWRDHSIIIDHRPWDRRWTNRAVYDRRFEASRPHYAGPRQERHDVRRDHDHDRGRDHDRDDRR